ncbi:hypothetical protein BC629DRAFT_1597028 [Irpex lacteus]|nr:hypothetical protein BC629DRAFT_1597028 [Irpex lacteus]
MATESEVHPATLKFQLAVPNVIQTISPALAALHVTRYRLIHSPNARSHTFDTTHCTACGTLLAGGSGSVRVMRKHPPRKSGKPYLRVIRRSCEVCGEHQDVPIEEGGASGFAKVGKQRLQEVVPISVSDPAPRTEPVAVVEPAAVSIKPAPSPVPPNTPSPIPSSSAQIPRAKSKEPKSVDGRSKSRIKKKNGLSDMLARNKERQEKERSAQGSTGLAAFLQNL